MIKEMVAKEDYESTASTSQRYTPTQKLSRSDVRFPLTTPRRMRAPSITSLTDILDQESVQDSPTLTLRVKALDFGDIKEDITPGEDGEQSGDPSPRRSIHDLPLEVQGNVLDYIFGDLLSVSTANNSLRGKNVASSMRHPRRKAVSDLALVSETWRDLVQARIYRHIKIKGTRAGLRESSDFFSEHGHLTKHIRHIEFWVPVWGDKASLERAPEIIAPPGRNGYHHLAHPGNEGLNTITANDLLGFNFKLSVYSATLQEIFWHTNCFFPEAKIFTLEGGHCKKSNMIRHFPTQLFPSTTQALESLPNIRTFAMRGAWNIMRDYKHWTTISNALPNIEEWHCGYAKPQPEAYSVINSILLRMPIHLKHLNISLDGMYSKDNSTLSSTAAVGAHHLCTHLGRIALQLESLTYTGKICSCFWSAACESVRSSRISPPLSSVEIVVKSCCRRQITALDPVTGETFTADEPSSIIADGAGITNMPFIRAFERLTTSTVAALALFQSLEHIRIRFIDLDSPCALLNPYFQLKRGRCYGLWNEEILELLDKVRPGLCYAELGDGINSSYRKEESSGATGLYPKKKPGAIKASSYRLIAETRG